MKSNLRLIFLVISLAQWGGVLPADEGLSRTQTISLKKGWNAVFLEVDPPDPDPAVVFNHVPVETVATFVQLGSTAQFVVDPTVDLSREAGWLVWYPDDRPEAFLKTLHAIYGQQAYLIEARTAYTWQITGAALSPDIQWQADAFNFVGFSVDAQAAPTYAQFFAGSDAHRHNRLYRLDTGKWRRVTNPAAETMKSGEAFWIYTESSSKYQGPLGIKTPIKDGLVLISGATQLELYNHTNHPLTPTVEHIVPSSSPVPLSLVIRAINEETLTTAKLPIRKVSVPEPAGPWALALPQLGEGEAVAIPLEARAEDMTGPVHASLLKITTDLGTEAWIQVVAYRQDLDGK